MPPSGLLSSSDTHTGLPYWSTLKGASIIPLYPLTIQRNDGYCGCVALGEASKPTGHRTLVVPTQVRNSAT